MVEEGHDLYIVIKGLALLTWHLLWNVLPWPTWISMFLYLASKQQSFIQLIKTHPQSVKLSYHSGFPCINFVLKIMTPKKGSKPKIFIKHTIFRWFQVPALTFRHLGPFLTFFLIFLDFYLMISWNST